MKDRSRHTIVRDHGGITASRIAKPSRRFHARPRTDRHICGGAADGDVRV